jgi:very-short-patch-repair endonuclease
LEAECGIAAESRQKAESWKAGRAGGKIMKGATVLLAKRLARDLRKRPTPAESLLWEELRSRRFLGKKFLRQHPLFFEYNGKPSFFITDLYCHQHRLVLEIDGKSHDYQKEYDELRTHVINSLAISVVRFKNEEIVRNMKGALKQLKEILGAPGSER